MPVSLDAVRAEALFASSLQSTDHPAPEQVRDAVTATLRRWGVQGCAACVAGEFGDHPDVAVVRMRWALAEVRAAYPSTPAPATLVTTAATHVEDAPACR